MNSITKNFLIIGLGRFGTSLCSKLVDLKQNVIGVDNKAGPVHEMADKITVSSSA
jgi:trk system potassium uptake protein TrkA